MRRKSAHISRMKSKWKQNNETKKIIIKCRLYAQQYRSMYCSDDCIFLISSLNMDFIHTHFYKRYSNQMPSLFAKCMCTLHVFKVKIVLWCALKMINWCVAAVETYQWPTMYSRSSNEKKSQLHFTQMKVKSNAGNLVFELKKFNTAVISNSHQWDFLCVISWCFKLVFFLHQQFVILFELIVRINHCSLCLFFYFFFDCLTIENQSEI